MNPPPRIMVATEVVGDADLVRKLLRDEFGTIAASTDPERAVADFEKHRPDVLVLAFDRLENAERYYLGLYRLSSLIHAQPHRTLILCNKDDLRRVYELCKKEHFDDYVLFWPLNHDAPRLPMAVHHMLRQLAAGAAGAPTAAEFATLARRLVAMEALVDDHAARGAARFDEASHTLRQARQDIGVALDGFAENLSRGELAGLVELKDAPGFQREIDRLKAVEVEARLDDAAAAAAPMRDWAGTLKQQLAPQMAAARGLQALVERLRPSILMVDDDELQHKLVGAVLRDANLEIRGAKSGAECLSLLRRCRFDLILMDVALPDMDGVEVTRRIRAVPQFAAVPILMVTGNSDKEVVLRSMKAGASGFVVKPFGRDALLAKILGHLEGHVTGTAY